MSKLFHFLIVYTFIHDRNYIAGKVATSRLSRLKWHLIKKSFSMRRYAEKYDGVKSPQVEAGKELITMAQV